MSRRQPEILVEDEAALVTVGAALARVVTPGLVVYLEGELGAGKTTLCRGLIHTLGHHGAVKSPTYTLVEPYELPIGPVYHFDLYRLQDPEELEFLGIRDYVNSRSLCLIEWPQRGQGTLPSADLVITIEPDGAGRRLDICANGALGIALLQRFRNSG